MEELDVHLDDGTLLELMFKDLSRQAQLEVELTEANKASAKGRPPGRPDLAAETIATGRRRGSLQRGDAQHPCVP